MDPAETQRRDERSEQGARRARAAFPGYEVAISLNHDGRECWHVAVHVKDQKFTESGEDLDAVLARLAQKIARETSS